MRFSKANLEAALELARCGIPCFPCGPDKKPKIKNWRDKATTDEQQIRQWWERFGDAMPAIPTGDASGFCVVDLDVRPGKNGIEMYQALGFDPADAGAIVKTAGGGQHLYFQHVDGLRNSQGRLGDGIDVRAEGGYVIAPGATGPAGTYLLVSGPLDTIKLLGSRPPDRLIDREAQHRKGSRGSIKAELFEIADALSYVPNDGPREHWIRNMMAVHAATGGSAEGLELAQSWSEGYPGYDPSEVEEQWRSFRLDRPDGITAATLFREARKCGWNGISDDHLDDLDDLDTDERDEPVGPIEELNQRYALVRLGGSTAIADFRPNGDVDFLSSTAFRELYANRKYGKKSLGAAWITHPSRRTYPEGVTFDPSGETSSKFLNLYRGLAVEPDPDAPFDLILSHITEILASGNQEHADYIVSWLADLVQNPAEKPGVALVLKGKKGVGKDTLAEIMKAIVGRRHSAHVASTQRLTTRFNAAFATALLIHVEEAIWGGQQDAKGIVQSLITCPSLPLERKHVDTVEVDNYSRLLFTTNESWAVPATADERRYAVFQVSAAHKDDRDYFNAIYDQTKRGGLAGFLAFLQAWEAPKGIEIRNPPKTKGLMEQKLAGLRSVEKWWYDVLCVGELPGQDDGFDYKDQRTSDNWSDAPQAMSREALRNNYREWMRQMRFHGDPKCSAEFGETLRSLCPEMKDCRPTENGQRVRKYRFPPLNLCRDAFAYAMGGNPDDLSWTS